MRKLKEPDEINADPFEPHPTRALILGLILIFIVPIAIGLLLSLFDTGLGRECIGEGCDMYGGR